MLFSANKYIYYLPETDKKLLAPPPPPQTPTQKEGEETQVKLSTIISNTNTSDEGLYQTTNGKRSYNRFFAIFFLKKYGWTDQLEGFKMIWNFLRNYMLFAMFGMIPEGLQVWTLM